ncbi:MAG: hypothetical protein ACLPH3_18110 [Terracidiphilus sp.]
MHVSSDGKMLEVGEPAPPFTPFDSPQFVFGLSMERKISRVDRFAVHSFGEAEKHLRQITFGLETIRAWAVIPFLQASEFHLQAQILQVQIIGALLLLSGMMPLPVALGEQRMHHCLQGVPIVG